MIEDKDDFGFCTWFPLLIVFVFLLCLFVGIFGTPMTQLEKEEYLRENWPHKYEELIKQKKVRSSRTDATEGYQKDIKELVGKIEDGAYGNPENWEELKNDLAGVLKEKVNY